MRRPRIWAKKWALRSWEFISSLRFDKAWRLAASLSPGEKCPSLLRRHELWALMIDTERRRRIWWSKIPRSESEMCRAWPISRGSAGKPHCTGLLLGRGGLHCSWAAVQEGPLGFDLSHSISCQCFGLSLGRFWEEPLPSGADSIVIQSRSAFS